MLYSVVDGLLKQPSHKESEIFKRHKQLLPGPREEILFHLEYFGNSTIFTSKENKPGLMSYVP